MTNLNVFAVAEIDTLKAAIAELNAENLELASYVENLISQRAINVELESYLIWYVFGI